MSEQTAMFRARPPRVYAALLVLIGLTLLAGGAYLVVLAGSPYYALCGLAVCAAGVLLWRGDARGAWLYAAMLAATLFWAFWEVGFDGWALAARLLAPAVLGLWLLTPWVRRGLS